MLLFGVPKALVWSCKLMRKLGLPTTMRWVKTVLFKFGQLPEGYAPALQSLGPIKLMVERVITPFPAVGRHV